MNKDIAQGKWKQLKGKIESEWGELTNDPVDEISGDKTKLQGHLQESYGWSKEEAEENFKKLDKMYDKD